MLVLGLDIATSTGVCWMDTALPSSKWRCLAIEAEGEFQEEKATDLAVYLNGEFFRTRPDFVVIEMPRRDVAAYPKTIRDPRTGQTKTIHTVNADQLVLPAMVAAATTACDMASIPWGLVHQKTWRASYYGKVYKPKGDDWKAPAVEAATNQGIPLPSTKKAMSDAAEAVGIAYAWAKCSQVPSRHHAAFAKLRAGFGRVAA